MNFILITIYALVTIACIVLTRRAQYFTSRFDSDVKDSKEEKRFVRRVIIGSYAFSVIPLLNLILLTLLIFGHMQENWKMLYLDPHQKRWIFRGSYQKYKGIGFGFIPFALTENPRNDIPHPEDCIHFGLDLYIPFIRLQGTITLKYRK